MALTAKREQMALTGYGASEVGTIAGLNNFSTPIEIFEKRVFGKVKDEPTLPAELGTLLEEPLAKKYAADTGLHVARCDTLRHPVQTFALAIATPDRIAFAEKRASRAMIHDVRDLEGATRNVQIKTASMWNRKEWGEAGTDSIPKPYLAQVHWEMGVTGLRVTDVPVLFDKAEFAIFRVHFDEDVFHALYEMVERFHVEHVLARVPPPVDGSEKYKEFLSRRFAEAGKIILDVPAGSPAEAQVLRYGELKAEAKRIDAEMKMLSNAIRGAIGDAQGLSGTWGTLKWHRKPGAFATDWEAIAREAVPEEQLSAFIARHQIQKAPYDQLRASWSKAVQFVGANTNTEE
ncbi:MAG: YqaJ viral recombinase family protein [Myxococcota bacterium]